MLRSFFFAAIIITFFRMLLLIIFDGGGIFSPARRQQDVRATEIDKVDMYLSFRPGDIVRALVVSFGSLKNSVFLGKSPHGSP